MKWKTSQNDKNWWYIPAVNPTPTRPVETTLNIVKKNGYKLYLNNDLMGRFKDLKTARKRAYSIRRKN